MLVRTLEGNYRDELISGKGGSAARAPMMSNIATTSAIQQIEHLKKECLKNLSELYGAEKKYKESYEFQLLFRKYYDSTEAELQKAKLKEFELRYELARSGKTPVKTAAIYEERQKKFIWTLLAIIALLGFLLVREKMKGKGGGSN